MPAPLQSDGLAPVWEAVRLRLERTDRDGEAGGRVSLPDLSSADRLALESLLGRRPGRTIALQALDAAFTRLGLGPDLAASLAVLGHPVSTAPASARAERRVGRDARVAARAEAAGWDEPWAGEWIDDVVKAGILRGLGVDQAIAFVRAARRVLDHLGALDDAVAAGTSPPVEAIAETRPGRGRVDVAAAVLGSAHALDTGSRMEAALTRALAHRLGPASARDLWEQSGAHLDLTSGPVLTWNLRLPPGHPLAPMLNAATTAKVPVHLTQFALRTHPIDALPIQEVLLVENPRIAEAAAQLGVADAVIATNGNPSGAVQLLVNQLLTAGARLRYHGDFDTPGLVLCARMARLGVEPWGMGAADYEAALAEAATAGVDLPEDDGVITATPWDADLAASFERHRLVIHEERLLPGLLLSRS